MALYNNSLRYLGMLLCVNSLSSFATTVSFDANQSNPTIFTGFGAMVWDGPQGASLTALQQLFQLDGFRIARINHEIRNVTIPEHGTFADYQALWASNGDGATDLQLPSGTYKPIEFMYLASIPCTFIYSTGYGNVCPTNCTNGCSLKLTADLVSLANYLAAGVQHFNQVYGALTSCPGGTSGCYQANYVELSNEPNGNWDVQFAPIQYSHLVKYVHERLVNVAPNTLITGPGVSHVDWDTGTDYFSLTLGHSALAALGAWSVHQYVYKTTSSGEPYENVDSGSSVEGYGQTAARYFFSNWYNYPSKAGATKPVVVSELNTNATGFHGVTYSPPNGTSTYDCQTPPFTSSNCTIVNTTPYGVRIYTYLISLLAGGANSAIYWQAMDETWQLPTYGGSGLYDVNLNLRSIYYALLPLFQNLPANSKVLVASNEQAGDDIYSVSFITSLNSDSTVNCMVIALANGTDNPNPISRTTLIMNLPNTATGFTATTQLFSQQGPTVYEGQLLNNDPFSTFSLSNGVLTHTTQLAMDTAVTARVCLTY